MGIELKSVSLELLPLVGSDSNLISLLQKKVEVISSIGVELKFNPDDFVNSICVGSDTEGFCRHEGEYLGPLDGSGVGGRGVLYLELERGMGSRVNHQFISVSNEPALIVVFGCCSGCASAVCHCYGVV